MRARKQTAVLLLIVLSHGLIIEALLRMGKEITPTKAALSEALHVYFLPQKNTPVGDVLRPENLPKTLRRSWSLDSKTWPDLAPFGPLAPIDDSPPAAPPIDWQNQLELAAKNLESDAEMENAYRDLSKSLSPSQLDWLKNHHMEPANPGITWKTPRVEITKDGLPIVHINDHCVLVPIFLVPMVFCGVGHIEPNGDLFKHMHDVPH